MQNSFQELVDDYVIQGKSVNFLTTDELFNLSVEHLKHKAARTPWNKCSIRDNAVDVELSLTTLHQLQSPLASDRRNAIEDIKKQTIDACINDIDEILEDEINARKNDFTFMRRS